MTQTMDITSAVDAAKEELDRYTREMVQWHFSSETGSPYWLDWAKEAGWNPSEKVKAFEDLMRFENFEMKFYVIPILLVLFRLPLVIVLTMYSKLVVRLECRSNVLAGKTTRSITLNSVIIIPTTFSLRVKIG